MAFLEFLNHHTQTRAKLHVYKAVQSGKTSECGLERIDANHHFL